MKRLLIWIGSLLLGTLIGALHFMPLDAAADFLAVAYIRVFQVLAIPTLFVTVTTTLATTGSNKGHLFGRTVCYTLFTTVAAAVVGAFLFVVIAPGNLPAGIGSALQPELEGQISYSEHLLHVIPDNAVRSFLDGNVLSILLIAFAIGLSLSRMPASNRRNTLVEVLLGFQDILFMLIKALIWILPLGIAAFAAQLASQLSAGFVVDSLGLYVAVVLGGNVIQFFVVLPLLLLVRGLNPLKVLSAMGPAIIMAFFTKSSAATLPVTLQSAEERLKISSQTARFVLPVCTTVNMNGCAAFILVTSLFVMQNGGLPITAGTIAVWVLIAVVCAVGNAGVPMGCYFLTFSLMSGIGAPVAVLGVILPVYTMLDMVETAENVWSDSCVCALVDRDVRRKLLQV